MPFNKIEKEYLKPFSDNADKILQEYNQARGSLDTDHPYGHPLWHLIFIHEYEDKKQNRKRLPTLDKLLSNLPKEHFLVLALVSVVSPGMVGEFHNEPYPRELGYRRYHIPLEVPEGAHFEIQGEEPYKWETGVVYEFENPGTMHRIIHKGNKDRIVLIIDVFEGYHPDQQTLDYVRHTGEQFIDYNAKGKY